MRLILIYFLSIAFGMALSIPPAANDTSLTGFLIALFLGMLFLVGLTVLSIVSKDRLSIALVFLMALIQAPTILAFLLDKVNSSPEIAPYQFVTNPKSWLGKEKIDVEWVKPLSDEVTLQKLVQKSCGSSGCTYRHLLVSSRSGAVGSNSLIDWIATECNDIDGASCIDGIRPIHLIFQHENFYWLLRDEGRSIASRPGASSSAQQKYRGSFILKARSDGKFEQTSHQISSMATICFLMSWLPLIAFFLSKNKLKSIPAFLLVCTGFLVWVISYGTSINYFLFWKP